MANFRARKAQIIVGILGGLVVGGGFWILTNFLQGFAFKTERSVALSGKS